MFPPILLAILDRMLTKNPAERIQTAGDVAELLRQWLVQNAGPPMDSEESGRADGLRTNGRGRRLDSRQTRSGSAARESEPDRFVERNHVRAFRSRSIDGDAMDYLIRRQASPGWWDRLKGLWRNRGRKH